MYLYVNNRFYDNVMRKIELISTDYVAFCAKLEEITGNRPVGDDSQVFAFSPAMLAELIGRFETLQRHTCDIATGTPYEMVSALLDEDSVDNEAVMIPCPFDALIGQGLVFYLGQVHTCVLMLRAMLEQQGLIENDLNVTTKYLGSADVVLLWVMLDITRKPLAELVHLDERIIAARISPEK